MAESVSAITTLVDDDSALYRTLCYGLEQCFDEMMENCYYLDAQIPILSKAPSPLIFYRDYVSCSNFDRSLGLWLCIGVTDQIRSDAIQMALFLFTLTLFVVLVAGPIAL